MKVKTRKKLLEHYAALDKETKKLHSLQNELVEKEHFNVADYLFRVRTQIIGAESDIMELIC